VNHPPVPLEKIVAMLNLDMVGRMKDNLLLVSGQGRRRISRSSFKIPTRDRPSKSRLAAHCSAAREAWGRAITNHSL